MARESDEIEDVSVLKEKEAHSDGQVYPNCPVSSTTISFPMCVLMGSRVIEVVLHKAPSLWKLDVGPRKL